MKLLEYILLSVVLWSVSCANPVAPTGGPKDTEPPRLDSSESTPNYQTNFEQRTIILAFDEYIQLETPNQNVVVSPPLEYPLDFTIRGASVHISFDDEEILKPKTTYTINMSNAIVDLNEGNPAEDIRYVFSTGAVIDSLGMSAMVKDALSGEAVEGAFVFLYKSLEDSVIYRQKPYYFGRTDGRGQARLQNLGSGTYKVIALEDVNRNLVFDLQEERLGFLENPIRLNTNSDQTVTLRISRELPSLIVTEQKRLCGRAARIGFNRPPGMIQLRGLDIPVDHALYRDSLYFWWGRSNTDSISIELIEESMTDTLTFQETDSDPACPLKIRSEQKSPSPPKRLFWNQPIDSVHPALIKRRDSLELSTAWLVDVAAPARDQLVFRSRGEYPERDTITFLPGAIRGRFGELEDSLTMTWRFKPPNALANLTIRLDSLDPEVPYLLRLVEAEDRTKLIASTQMRGQTQYQWILKGLIPQSMELELIRDLNRNNQWDPVQYLQGRQAEAIYRKSITNLRANWDVELTLDDPL